MEVNDRYIKISPEVISGDIFPQTYDGKTFGIYSSMTMVLSAGTNGSSLLTGLTIPIVLEQSVHNIGYYDVFDGEVLQKDTVSNFIFTTGSTTNPYKIYVYNTSDTTTKKYLELSTYEINWGDSTTYYPYNSLNSAHTYSISSGYTITLRQTNPWGVINVIKNIKIPYDQTPDDSNPNGTATFTPSGGSWIGTPISYDYIFPFDSNINKTYQVTSNFPQFYQNLNPTLPFAVTSFTKSELTTLERYQSPQYQVNYQVYLNQQYVGKITSSSQTQINYTIYDIDYIDFSDGTSVRVAYSSGVTPNNITQSAITKNEVLMNMVEQPQIQSNVFIERGKSSGLESLRRIGEVDSIRDLERYGYKYFNIIEN
jgi:hypothetical protein